MEFNKEKYIQGMAKSVNKLVEQFTKKGVEFSPTDGELANVVFTQTTKDGVKEVKISHHSFYRFSGIACITKDKGDNSNTVEIVVVTDEMYLQTFIKPIIEVLLTK